MNIARVFPRKTAMTPEDELAFVNCNPPMFLPEVDEVHISVAWTYDIPIAEDLVYQWETVGVPVKLGGPAYDDPCGGEFIPGMYVKKGNVFTSRGCNNKCWFCSAWRREGKLRELEVKDGWNILDNNLLQCSEKHIKDVFAMLKRQKQKAVFTGGLEAKMLEPWHCDLLADLKPSRMYFAYDTPDDYEPLVAAGKMLIEAGVKPTGHSMCCYNLCGFKGDTFEAAEKRFEQTIKAGFMPYAMLFRDKNGNTDAEWRKFQREWCRPAIVAVKFKEAWDGRT